MNEDKLLKAAEKAIYESITNTLSGYSSPVKDAVNAALKKHESRLRDIAEKALLSVLDDDAFEVAIYQAVNDKIARVLINQIGGEVEKQVNELKANPETRAKITLALTKIVKG